MEFEYGLPVYKALSENAYTDLISNAMHIPDIDTEDAIISLISNNQLPMNYFSPYLHELVHVHCFSTPLGSLLSNIKLSVLDYAFELEQNKKFKYLPNFLNDLKTSEVCSHILRPFAEGLALFAEFDILPDPDQGLSKPMLWSYITFTKPSSDEITKGNCLSLLGLLFENRTSEDTVNRKTNLLIQPLDCSHGGYLPGYLAIKSMWVHACKKCSEFFNTDLFFRFIVNYIYCDFGFIKCILQSGSDKLDENRSSRISAYFRNRLAAFFEIDLQEALMVFKTTTHNKSSYGALKYRGNKLNPVLTSALDEKHGIALYSRFIRKFIARTRQWGSSNHRRIFPLILASRHLIWWGGVDVKIEFVGKKLCRCTTQKGHHVYLNTVSRKKLHSIQASMEFFYSPDLSYKLIIASKRGEIIAMKLIGKCDRSTKFRLENFLCSRKTIETELSDCYLWNFRNFTSRAKIDIACKEWITNADTFATDLYSRTAEFGIRKLLPDDMRSEMLADGIFPLLNQDIDLLKNLTTLSIASSMRLGISEVSKEFSFFPMEKTHKLLSELKAISEKTGYPLIVSDADILFSYV